MTRQQLQNELFSNPNYRDLSYEAQLKVWNKMIQENLSKNKDFLALTDDAKWKVFNQVSLVPPAINTTNMGEDRKASLEGWIKDGQEIIKIMSGPGSDYMKKNRVLDNLENFLKRQKFAIGASDTGVGKIVTKAGDALFPDMAVGKGGDAEINKVLQYLGIVSSNNGGGTGDSWQAFGGILYDIAGFYAARGVVTKLASGLTGAIATKLATGSASRIAGGLKKLSYALQGPGSAGAKTLAATAKGGRIATWAAGTFAPWIADATLDGITGLAVEEFGNIVQGEGNSIIEKGFVNNLKKFGQYAAMDYLFGTAASILTPFFKLGAKVVRNTFKLKNPKIKGFVGSEEDLMKILMGAQEVTPINKKWLEDFAPGPRDLIEHNRIVQAFEASGEVGRGNPLAQTWVTGNTLGNVIVPDGAGYRVRSLSKKGGLTEFTKVESFEELNEMILKQFQGANKAQLDHLASSNPKHGWLNTMNDAFKRLDIPFSSELLMKELADDSLLKKGLKSNDYTFPSERSQLHTLEYAQVLKSAEGSGIGPIRGNLIKGPDGNFHIQPDEAGKYVTIASKVASPDDYMAHLALAQKMDTGGLEIPKEKMADMLLARKGIDSVQMADGSIRPLMQKKIKVLSDKVDLETGKVMKEPVIKQGPDIDQDIIIKKTIDAAIPEDTFTDAAKNILDNSKDLRRVANPDTIKKMMDSVSEAFGKKIDYTFKVGDAVEVKAVGNGLEITTPRDLHAISTRKKFVEEVLSKIDNMDTGVATTTKIRAKSVLADTAAKASKSIEKQQFLKAIVESAEGNFTSKGGKYIIKLKDGSTMTFNDIDKAAKAFYIKNDGIDVIRANLETTGYKVMTNEGGTTVTKNGEVLIDSKKDLTTALIDSDADILKASSLYAQPYAVLDNTMNLQVEATITVGKKNDLLKHYDKFTDYHANGQMKVLSDQPSGRMLETPKETYEIRSEKYGYVKQFNHPREARLFLENIDEMDNLFKMADDKNLQLSVKGDMFTLKGNGVEFTGKNMDDLAAAMRKSPSVLDTPEIVRDPAATAAMEQTKGIDVEFSEVVARNPAVHPIEIPKTLDDYKQLGLIKHSSAYVELTSSWFVKAAEKSGDRVMVKLFTNMEDSRRFAQIQSNKYHKIVESIFVDNKGKFFSAAERRAIFHLGEGVEVGNLGKILGEKKFVMKPEIAEAGNRLRVVYDNLFTSMGVDGKKFRTQYLPHLRKWVKDNSSIAEAYTGDEILNVAFKDNRPKEMDVFFKHERATEVMRNILNDDAYAVTQIYIERGMKSLYMDEAYKKLSNYMNDAMKAGADPMLQVKMNQYFDSLMGFGNVQGVKAVDGIAKKFIDKIMPKYAKSHPGYSTDLINKLMTLNYVTSMGLKPYLGIRNLLQPWMTFAPRFGMGVTKRAYTEVAKNGDKIIKYLMDNGMISRADPLMTKLGDDFLGKVAHASLKGFTSSDQFTRAIAYSATKEMFDEAAFRFQKGLIDINGFEKLSGLNLIDNKSVIDRVKGLVIEGELEAGLQRYATQTIEETMFPYRPSEKPLLGANNIFGKFFWQYGTYSSGYVSNVLRGFKNGTWAQKVGYVARLGLSAAVIGSTLKELNIQNQNFIPWTPMLFSGGPFVDISFDIIKSFDSGYQGEQARARLRKFVLPYKDKNGRIQFGSGLPMSYQIRNIQKGLKALEDGESWLAWLFFTSTPVDPEKSKNFG